MKRRGIPSLPPYCNVLIHYANFASPVGPLRIAASDKGLVLLEFASNRSHRPSPSCSAKVRGHPLSKAVESTAKLEPYIVQLRQYFAGERREFTLPLDLYGTDFQLRCWHALLEIDYGETRTYAQLARAVGSPNGDRKSVV